MTPARARKPRNENREFTFDGRDFQRVCRLIRERAGISLAESKQDMVYSRLVRRVRALGIPSFSAYLDRLEQTGNADEWQAFVNALTTNLTSFFREAHHFDHLAGVLKSSKESHITIWCCAASTGEEAYSLAITACEAFDSLEPPVSILATDVDTDVLETAKRGVYGMERIAQLDDKRRRRFFHRGVGTMEGSCRVRPELQKLITFRPLNLLDRTYPIRHPFAAIFCRNVMIYFDKQTQHDVLTRMRTLIQPDGFFYAGHSESFLHAANLFHTNGRTIYQPVEAGGNP